MCFSQAGPGSNSGRLPSTAAGHEERAQRTRPSARTVEDPQTVFIGLGGVLCELHVHLEPSIRRRLRHALPPCLPMPMSQDHPSKGGIARAGAATHGGGFSAP